MPNATPKRAVASTDAASLPEPPRTVTAGPKLSVRDGGPTLFDLEPAASDAGPTTTSGRPSSGRPSPGQPSPGLPSSGPKSLDRKSLGHAVVRSAVFKGQRKVAGRLIVTDDQVGRLVDELAAANATRLPSALAAQALGVAQTRLRGALTQVQQLLNVEGYAVLAVEAATGVVLLDLRLLAEQFEVRS